MTEQLHEITVTVNGAPRTATAPARRLLSDFLRHDLRLTGTHVGCEHGVCGCCTVLLDGQPVRSCLVFAVSVRGRELTTVEGLAAPDGTLHPVQQALQDHHGLQCGFCTPGFVTSVCGFLADAAEDGGLDHLDDDAVREGVAGNLCRCTGYTGILAAVKQAAAALRETGADPRGRHTAGAPNRPADPTTHARYDHTSTPADGPGDASAPSTTTGTAHATSDDAHAGTGDHPDPKMRAATRAEVGP